jgi:hypothetical protein
MFGQRSAMRGCRHYRWPIAVVIAIGIYGTPPCAAFCFQPIPTVECEFLNSSAVFVATVVSERTIPAPNDQLDDGFLYSVTVQKVFRGELGANAEVFTENNSARYTLDVGKQYLLFASKSTGLLVISGCGNSAELPKAAATIRKLRGLGTTPTAVIEGRISFSGIPDDGAHVAGFKVIVRGRSRTFRATSDENGWFHLRVPPGQYSAEITNNPHWKIEPFDLSLNDPLRFVARKGHCSGLQFLASPK